MGAVDEIKGRVCAGEVFLQQQQQPVVLYIRINIYLTIVLTDECYPLLCMWVARASQRPAAAAAKGFLSPCETF